jgi:hypothetical protein
LYVTWIKIDDTLPWIELKREYETKSEAKKAANVILKNAKIKIVKAYKTGERIKVLATVRAAR